MARKDVGLINLRIFVRKSPSVSWQDKLFGLLCYLASSVHEHLSGLLYVPIGLPSFS